MSGNASTPCCRLNQLPEPCQCQPPITASSPWQVQWREEPSGARPLALGAAGRHCRAAGPGPASMSAGFEPLTYQPVQVVHWAFKARPAMMDKDGWMLHTLRQYTWRGRKRPGCEARRPPPSKLWRPGRQEAGTRLWPHRHSNSRRQTKHSHSELVRAAETGSREKGAGATAAARPRGARGGLPQPAAGPPPGEEPSGASSKTRGSGQGGGACTAAGNGARTGNGGGGIAPGAHGERESQTEGQDCPGVRRMAKGSQSQGAQSGEIAGTARGGGVSGSGAGCRGRLKPGPPRSEMPQGSAGARAKAEKLAQEG